MQRFWIVLSLTALISAPLLAGVVYEIEVTDHDAGPEPRVQSTEIAVQGKDLKAQIASDGTIRGDMIFRGERREMVFVDHERKSYFMLDGEKMKGMAAQMNAAMAQVEEMLENVPEGQREMMRKMMEQRMPKQPQAAERPKSTVRNTGEKATHAGYPCVKYEVLVDGEKVTEYWVTDWANVPGGSDTAGAFVEMAEFSKELTSAFESGPFGSQAGETPFEHMNEIDGFPVVTRNFAGGELESESTLRSAEERDLDPDAFEPPKGYRLRAMGPE